MTGPTTAPTPAPPPRSAVEPALRWMAIANGALAILVGGCLLVVPGPTLTFVAVLAGLSLLIIGLVDLARTFLGGLTLAQRAAHLFVGALAIVVGAVVVLRPDGSVKVVAIMAGLYLIIMGAVRLSLGAPGMSRTHAALRGAVGLVAGVTLLAWPEVTVGLIAVVYGVFLVLLGLAEVLLGVRASRAPTPRP